MEILYHSDEPSVRAYSSIDQYDKFISTYERGGWTPIEFDHLDYIKCVDCAGKGKYQVVSHPIIIEFGDNVGYNFPIGECEYKTDEYIKFDEKGDEILALPDYYGDGFYLSSGSSEIIANFDDGTALSTRNNYKLKVGQDYYLADDFLPPAEG